MMFLAIKDLVKGYFKSLNTAGLCLFK